MNKQQTNKIVDLQVHNFFNHDILDFKQYPDDEVANYFSRKSEKNSILDLTPVKGSLLYDEIKDIFMCIFHNEEPYSYKSKVFPYCLILPQYMADKNYDSFFDIVNAVEENEKFIQYWEEKRLTKCDKGTHVISACYFTIKEYRDTRIGLERNCWRLKDIKINKERLNLANPSSNASINFWNITNEENREYCKTYFRYLLGGTELAYNTIINYFCKIEKFVNSLNKSLLEVTHDDISNYVTLDICKSSNNLNHTLSALKSFFDYLSVKGIYNQKCPITKEDFVKNEKKYIKSAIPETTFIELFQHIHKLPDNFFLMFLIDAFTGIRISDICQLKTDCLCQNEHGYFLYHDIQKMQNVGGIPISKELFDLIQKRIDYINSLNYKEQYLFPSVRRKNCPYNSQTYSHCMKKIIASWNIKTPDGEDYKFLTHAFRHTIATELYNLGMSPVLIQLGILHHTEIDMSRHYIEIDENTQIKIQKEKLDTSLKFNTTDVLPTDSVLPNGYCAMPAKIQCPNLNSCLNCKFFRTSLEFLDVHKKQLKELRKQLEYFETKNYIQNIATTKKEIEVLEAIIASLEKIKEVDINE